MSHWQIKDSKFSGKDSDYPGTKSRDSSQQRKVSITLDPVSVSTARQTGEIRIYNILSGAVAPLIIFLLLEQ